MPIPNLRVIITGFSKTLLAREQKEEHKTSVLIECFKGRQKK